MKSYLTCLTVLFLIIGCAGSRIDSQKIFSAELLDYGICTINLKKTVLSDTTASKGYNISEGVVFTNKTTTIPAEKGISFGIKYLVNGEPEGSKVTLKTVVIHPPIKGKTKSSAAVEARIGTWRADHYTFDKSYELVEGEWTFHVYHKGSLLIEKTFFVNKS